MTTPYKMEHLFISAVPHTSIFCPSQTVLSSLTLLCFSVLSSCGQVLAVRVSRSGFCEKLPKAAAVSGAVSSSRLKDRLASRPQSWNSPAGVGKDHGEADCTPAVCGGPWRSRYPQWTHAEAVCSWSTVSLGRNLHWRSSWRSTACEKDRHWRSLWRIVFWTVSLVEPDARTEEEHEEEGVAETKPCEQTCSFPIPLCWSRGERKIRLKLNLRRQKGGNKFLDLSLFSLFYSQEFLNWICFLHVSNEWGIAPCLYLRPRAFHDVLSPCSCW